MSTSTDASLPPFSATPTVIDPNPDNNNNNNSAFVHQPLAWVIIPILVILLIVFVATCFTLRRRYRNRRYARAHPGVNPEAGISSNAAGSAGRRPNRANTNATNGNRRPGLRPWIPWGNRNSTEGLNELGEAPPAYEPKAKPGQSLAGGQDESRPDTGTSGDVQLRDLQSRGAAAEEGEAAATTATTGGINGEERRQGTTLSATEQPPGYNVETNTMTIGERGSSPPPLITTPPPALSRH